VFSFAWAQTVLSLQRDLTTELSVDQPELARDAALGGSRNLFNNLMLITADANAPERSFVLPCDRPRPRAVAKNQRGNAEEHNPQRR